MSRWKIDMDEMDEAIYDVKEALETFTSFTKAFERLIKEVRTNAEGKTFEAIELTVDEDLKSLHEVIEETETIHKAMEKYADKIEDINPWSGRGDYKIDLDIARYKIQNLRKLLEDDFDTDKWKVDSFEDDFNSKINKYNHVDLSINLEEEYKDEPEVISEIKTKRREIDDKIRDFCHNKDIFDDALQVVKQATDKLDDLV